MRKKKTKKQKINRIIELITDGKVKKALELTDVKDAEDLLAMGILFGERGSHDVAEKIFTRVIELNPNDAEAWYNKGGALDDLGRYEEAIKCYDKALKINPHDAEVWSNKGVALENLGRYGEAVKCHNQALKINPNDAEAWYNKGVTLGNLGRYDEAIKSYDKALKINPHDAEVWSNKGVALENLGRYGEAVKCHNQALKINPKDDKAWYNKGVALRNLRRYDEAIKCYDQALKINPNYDKAWSNKGVAIWNLRRYDEAIKCYDQALKTNPNYADTWSNKGVALGNLRRYEEAIKCYDQALKINPNYDKAWSNKGVALGNLRRYEEEIKCYDQALKINPKLAEAWYNKGVALGNLGKYDEEIKCHDQALKINPHNADTWLNKGVALGNLGKDEEAIKCYDKALKINSNDAGTWSNKGVALGNLGSKEEAIKCYNKALKINPNYDKAWSNKGVALGNLGRYDEEIKCYDKALKINPNYDNAWSNKGVALWNLGKYDEEIQCYDQALKINPNHAEAHGNKGITLLYLHKYDGSASELRKAKEIFSKSGAKKDADKAHRHEILAINAAELMSRLNPLDKKFINCLSSKSLTELKDKSSKISKDVKSIVKEFAKKNIPEDARELLISKATCFSALSQALKFVKVDSKKLKKAKNVFEKWHLEPLLKAVNAIDTFVHFLRNYESLDKIPKTDAEYLLRNILSPAYILDGVLTKEIFRGKPFPARPTIKEKEPTIKYIVIPDISKDKIRVCLVQLDFSLSKKFPYQLIDRDMVKKKIFTALEAAKQKDVNILCFPELSFAKEWVDEVKQYKDMIVIGGSFYENKLNVCPVIIAGSVYPVYKIHPSPRLEDEVAPGKGMRSGGDIKIFGTKNGSFKFGVLVCIDYIKEGYRLYHYDEIGRKGVNCVFIPSFNQDPLRFQEQANLDCKNFHVDLIQTNVKEYGGSCIIGVEHEKAIERLINEGYRKKDDFKYKLCEANGEMLIIADLCMGGVEVPTSMDAKLRIEIIAQYKYKYGSWRE